MSLKIFRIARLLLVVVGLIALGTATAQTPPKPAENPSLSKLDERVDHPILFVNLNERAELLLPGEEPVKDPTGIDKYVRGELAIQKAKVGGSGNLIVIIRVPAGARFGDVLLVRDLCTRAGVAKIYLRAQQLTTDER